MGQDNKYEVTEAQKPSNAQSQDAISGKLLEEVIAARAGKQTSDNASKSDRVEQPSAELAKFKDNLEGKVIEGINSVGDTALKFIGRQVTEADRAEAKKKLDGQMSELIPEADRKTLAAIHSAIADGDIDGLSKAIQTFKGQPEKLKAFMKEVEKNLKAQGADGHVAISKDGKVLFYSSYGSTAVELGTDGSVGVRPISTRADGSAVLEPGEVLNKEPKDCMKEVSEAIVDGMTRPKFDQIIIGGGGRGGSGGLEPLPWPSKPEPIWPKNPGWGEIKPLFPKPRIIEPLQEEFSPRILRPSELSEETRRLIENTLPKAVDK